MQRLALCTGFTIQLIRESRRIALCCGSTRMTSKYLYVESWLIQYELRTLKFAHRRPTRSSAVDLSERWYLSWFTPWLVGFPVAKVPESAERKHEQQLNGLPTVCSAFGHRSLAAASTHTHAVYHIALLRFIPQTASFVRTRGTRGTVNDVQLAKLY